MASSCAGVASCPTASAPMTMRRSALCPTRKPAFTATRPSSRSSHEPKLSHSRSRPASSASTGIPSTRASIGSRYAAASGSIGAIEKPQLPPITVVTPCSDDGVAAGSHMICGS